MIDIETIESNTSSGKCSICVEEVERRRGFKALDDGEPVLFCCSCLNSKINKKNSEVR